MEPPSLPFVRAAAAGLTRTPRLLPSWLGRVARPRALAGGPAELVWTLLLAATASLILVVDLLAPNQIGAGALAVVPVLAASWTLGTRPLVVVCAIAMAIEVLAAGLGQLGPVMVAGRLVTIALIAAVGRSAAAAFEEVRHARQREVGVLLRSSRLLARSLDPDGVAAEAVRVAAGTLVTSGQRAIQRAALLRVSGDRAMLVASHDHAGASVRSGIQFELELMPAVVHEALASGRTGVVLTSELAPELRALLASSGAAAWAVARVQVAGQPFGILAAASADPDGFRPDDVRLLDGIARVTGLAIGAAVQHEELAELKQRLEHSVELALEVGRTLEPALVVDSILVRVSETVGADQATLCRVDGDDLVIESTYRARAGARLVPLRRHFPQELVEGIPNLARALATGQPVVGGPIVAAPASEELAAALAHGAHTLTLPFPVASRASCLLALARTEGRPFGEADLAQLEPMADVALLALRNAHLYAQTERAERAASAYSGQLEQAIEAAEEIGAGRELGDVVERVLRRAVAVVGADRGSIWRLEGGDMVMEFEHDPTRARLRVGIRRSLSDSRLAAEAVRRRRPLRGPSFGSTTAPDMEAWLERSGLLHVIQCPLLVQDEVFGLLGLSRRRDEPFTDADLQTLRPFATLAALLLRNARLLAEARQVGQAKSAILNLAAHELRTPLAVIKGYLSLLEDGTYPVPERTRAEAVDTLVAKAQELESLVETLLMTARLEGGLLVRSAVPLDLGLAVRDAVERIRPRARLEGARIEVQVPERGPQVRADRGHVARILDNLLNNALTYSPVPARVTVEVRPRDPVEVAVRDLGHGIPPDQHERVFERFRRIDPAPGRSTAGLGLGLTISRELAHLNGGALVLEGSEPGRGSVFVLRLPAGS